MAEARTTTKKKAAKKKTATRKTTAPKEDSGAGILQAIRAELAEEYNVKLARIKEDAEKAVNEAQEQAKKLERKLDSTRKSQTEQEEIASRLRDLQLREEALSRRAAEIEMGRESKINDIVNQRTARMKDKLDREFGEKLSAASSALLVGQDAQTKELYNRIASVLRESGCPAVVMIQTLGLLQQSILREQRVRLGVDAPPPAPPAPPPIPPEEAP